MNVQNAEAHDMAAYIIVKRDNNGKPSREITSMTPGVARDCRSRFSLHRRIHAWHEQAAISCDPVCDTYCHT